LGARLERAILERIVLFRHVDFESIQGLFDLCSTVQIKAGEVLLRAGEKNNFLYLCLAGKLTVHLPYSEKEEASIFIEPGESVGEMSVLDHEPVSAHVYALEDSILLKMEEEVVWSLIQSSHAFACNLLTLLASRLRRTNLRLAGKEADIDVLTGLRKREWFQELLARHLRRAVQDGYPTSLLLVDIDEFAAFVEKHGRIMGERVLYVVSSTLKNNLRPSEVVARWGESSFAVLLPMTAKATARTVAVRLHEAINHALSWVPSISISMGLSDGGQDSSSLILMTEAEDALRRARLMGGGAVSE